MAGTSFTPSFAELPTTLPYPVTLVLDGQRVVRHAVVGSIAPTPLLIIANGAGPLAMASDFLRAVRPGYESGVMVMSSMNAATRLAVADAPLAVPSRYNVPCCRRKRTGSKASPAAGEIASSTQGSASALNVFATIAHVESRLRLIRHHLAGKAWHISFNFDKPRLHHRLGRITVAAVIMPACCLSGYGQSHADVKVT